MRSTEEDPMDKLTALPEEPLEVHREPIGVRRKSFLPQDEFVAPRLQQVSFF